NQYLTAFSPSTQRQIKLLVSAWEYSALLSRHLRPFSRLDAIERQRFVQEAAHSRYPWRRIPIMWLKHLSGFVYGAAPEVEAAFDFNHTCLHDGVPQSRPRLSPHMYPELRGDVTEPV